MSVTLEEIDSAIRKILANGQSLTLSDGTRWEMANLKDLLKLRKEVAARQRGYRFYSFKMRGET